MSSRKKSKSARINGAKSKGPTTPEGRARSSQNSLRHGLRSETVVLPHEDRAQFEALRDSYMESFQPADQPQHDLIETMAAARWRLNRLLEMEAKIFETEMVLRAKEMQKELLEQTEVEKLAWVFEHMANHNKSLPLLIRYEGQLNRTYERAFKQLQVLQKTRPPAPVSEMPNEPKPFLVPTPTRQPNEPTGPENTPEEPPTPPSTPLSSPKSSSEVEQPPTLPTSVTSESRDTQCPESEIG